MIHAHSISQPDLLRELRAKFHDRFGVDHLTIQMETPISTTKHFIFVMPVRRVFDLNEAELCTFVLTVRYRRCH